MFIGSRKRNKGVVVISKKDYDQMREWLTEAVQNRQMERIDMNLDYLYESIKIDDIIDKEKETYDGYSPTEGWKKKIKTSIVEGMLNNVKVAAAGVLLTNANVPLSKADE